MFTWLVCVGAALGVFDSVCWFVGLGAFAGGCVYCFGVDLCCGVLLIVLVGIFVVRIYSYLLFTVSNALLRDLVDFVYVCGWVLLICLLCCIVCGCLLLTFWDAYGVFWVCVWVLVCVWYVFADGWFVV